MLYAVRPWYEVVKRQAKFGKTCWNSWARRFWWSTTVHLYWDLIGRDIGQDMLGTWQKRQTGSLKAWRVENVKSRWYVGLAQRSAPPVIINHFPFPLPPPFPPFPSFHPVPTVPPRRSTAFGAWGHAPALLTAAAAACASRAGRCRRRRAADGESGQPKEVRLGNWGNPLSGYELRKKTGKI